MQKITLKIERKGANISKKAIFSLLFHELLITLQSNLLNMKKRLYIIILLMVAFVLPGMKAWHSSLEEEIPMLGFVGSIAHYFESPLRNVMEDEFHLKISQILKAPMPGLIKYHIN
jgi:hypothetical protein